MKECVVLAVLFVAAVRDAKTRTVPDGFHLLIALCCLIPPVTIHPGGVLAALPLFLAAFMKGGVGGGDIKIMAVLGLVIGFGRASMILILALILLVCWHVIKMMMGKGERSYPLVPFLFTAAALTVWL